jgi:hypothetical protein
MFNIEVNKLEAKKLPFSLKKYLCMSLNLTQKY